MKQVVRVSLENEMDLILAHKRAMKLAELCGLSLTVQTTLATAVSEIARCALLHSKNAYLSLGISTAKDSSKQLTAAICNTVENCCANTEALNFARRLVTEVALVKTGNNFDIRLNYSVRFGALLTDNKIQSFVDYFRNEPPLSAYDEIRRKNIQLLELSDRLRESETQYRVLADTLPLMMFSLNSGGAIIYANQWLREYLGQHVSKLDTTTWQILLHPDDHVRIADEWSNSFRKKITFSTQGRLKNRRDNNYYWHLISITPVKGEANIPQQWIGFFVDIHTQKLAEETFKDNAELKETQKQLVEYQKMLEEKVNELNISNHELEQFAYIASHDLQEPLRKIVTFSSLLEERLKNIDDDSRIYFNKIVSSTKRMTALIKDVLDYSRIAKSNEEFSVVSLDNVLKNVMTDFDLLIHQRNAIVRTSGLPAVKGIPLQLNQLFHNLMSNSLKFNEKDPVITITAHRVPSIEITAQPKLNPSLSYIKLSFSDNGIGFDQQYAEQIFTIFQRLNGRSAYSGTGIGLALCRKIAENHHGMITAASEPGKGATFNVYLVAA